MPDIKRYETTRRLSRVVVHNGVVYLAGVTTDVAADDIAAQTRSVLETIDARLATVGSHKGRLLSAQIWLKDIDRDFCGLNAVWEAWLPADAAPTRATCQAKLAEPELLVEIIVTSAA